jgi:hypothetical protein
LRENLTAKNGDLQLLFKVLDSKDKLHKREIETLHRKAMESNGPTTHCTRRKWTLPSRTQLYHQLSHSCSGWCGAPVSLVTKIPIPAGLNESGLSCFVMNAREHARAISSGVIEEMTGHVKNYHIAQRTAKQPHLSAYTDDCAFIPRSNAVRLKHDQ